MLMILIYENDIRIIGMHLYIGIAKRWAIAKRDLLLHQTGFSAPR